MIRQMVLLFLSVLTVGYFSVASAADVTLNVSGTVVTSPCEIVGGSDKEVDLGRVVAPKDREKGFASPFVGFSLDLINCPTAYDNIAVVLGGNWDPNARIDNTGTAENVDIDVRIETAKGSFGAYYCAARNNDCVVPIDKNNATATIPFQASMRADQTFSSGSVIGRMGVTLIYQ